ncbi:hypothetical protein NKG94_11585 [Micromonospora sp. M12]
MTITVPDGGFFDFGDKIPYTVTVTDPEETTIDCAKVTVQTQLGHDSHAHPWTSTPAVPGCSPPRPTPVTATGRGRTSTQWSPRNTATVARPAAYRH